jgi:ATP-dependent DNA ligase
MPEEDNEPDLFETKAIKPMIIKELKEPFNSPDWMYELKLDGIRCIAYLDKKVVLDVVCRWNVKQKRKK